MKDYNTPKVNIVELHMADIITLSAPDDLADFDDTVSAPGTWFN